MQDLSQGGYGGGASQAALVSSVSCPTGGGGLLAELPRRQGQSQMETDGWEGDATAVVRPPARQLPCAAHAACALTESAGRSLPIHRMWVSQTGCFLEAASAVPVRVACYSINCVRIMHKRVTVPSTALKCTAARACCCAASAVEGRAGEVNCFEGDDARRYH